MQKLKDLGWGKELDEARDIYYSGLRLLPEMTKPKALTERGKCCAIALIFVTYVGLISLREIGWDKIKDKIVGHMIHLRNEKLESQREIYQLRAEEFTAVYQEWFIEQEDKRALPRAIDLMHRPEIMSLLRWPLGDTVTKQTFSPHRNSFSQWAIEWRHNCEDQIRELIHISDAFKNKITEDIDPLTLASVVFNCKKCEKDIHYTKHMPARYPGLLSHECLWRRIRHNELPEGVERGILTACVDEDYRGCIYRDVWSCEPLFIGKLHNRTMEVIQAAGKDPYKTTIEEMDQLDIHSGVTTAVQVALK